MIPDKPGWYWWTTNPDDEGHTLTVCRCVAMANGKAWAFPAQGVVWGHGPPESVGGEWGPAIPAPDRLKAMEELAAEEPWTMKQEDYCHYCSGYPCRKSGGPHDPDCPWLRAQEKPR